MHSERDYRTCLCPLLAFALVNDIADLIPGIQLVEAAAENSVPMEIDFIARLGDQEAVIRGQADDRPDRRRGMSLDITSHFAGMILQLALGCIEGIAYRNMEVLVRMMLGWITTHDNLTLRHDQLDPHVIEVALVVTPMVCLNHHAADYDPIEKMFKLGGTVADIVLGPNRWLHMAESNAKRFLHNGLLLPAPGRDVLAGQCVDFGELFSGPTQTYPPMPPSRLSVDTY